MKPDLLPKCKVQNDAIYCLPRKFVIHKCSQLIYISILKSPIFQSSVLFLCMQWFLTGDDSSNPNRCQHWIKYVFLKRQLNDTQKLKFTTEMQEYTVRKEENTV